MKRYSATLVRDVQESVTFQKNGNFGGHTIPITLSAGVRGFDRKAKAAAWVKMICDLHGEGAAILGNAEVATKDIKTV